MSQHMDALARANAVRLARAQLKREIAAGTISVLTVLAEPGWAMQSMTCHDLLCALPRVGGHRAGTMLNQAGVRPTRMLGELTARQRMMVASAIRETLRVDVYDPNGDAPS